MFRPMHPSIRDKRIQQLWLELERRIAEGFATSPGGSGIVWRPGAPPGQGVLTTWPEVMEQIADSPSPLVVLCDNSLAPCEIPPGTYDMRGATFSGVSIVASSNAISVEIQDGAFLQDLAGVTDTMLLAAAPTSGPCLTFSQLAGASRVFVLERGAQLQNNGTGPMIHVASPDVFLLATVMAATLSPGSSGSAVVDAAAGSTVLAFVQTSPGALCTDWLSGAGGLLVAADASYQAPSLASHTGGETVLFIDQALSTGYNPSNPGDWSTVPTTVGQALDLIAAKISPV